MFASEEMSPHVYVKAAHAHKESNHATFHFTIRSHEKETSPPVKPTEITFRIGPFIPNEVFIWSIFFVFQFGRMNGF